MSQRPKGNADTTDLLKECSHKMTPDDILLHAQIGALLSHHQRSCLLKKMGTNTETHSWTVRNLGTVSPQWHISINSLPSGLRELFKEEVE